MKFDSFLAGYSIVVSIVVIILIIVLLVYIEKYNKEKDATSTVKCLYDSEYVKKIEEKFKQEEQKYKDELAKCKENTKPQ